MAYDHRTKAGNQGDVVKHVALLAAVRHAFDVMHSTFRYADAYAGPAGSLLLPGGEWSSGIGKLNRSAEVRSADVGRWIRWYLARPQLVGSRYPGSVLIVSDAAAEVRKPLAMSLWDSSAEAVADLKQIFPNHTVLHASVDASAEAIGSADLLFVDPPALADQWELILRLAGPDLALYGELTGTENLRFFLRAAGFPADDADIRQRLSETGLSPAAGERRVDAYSTGMRQRLRLAFARLFDPPLLVLDEPFTGLDAEGRELVHRLVADARRRGAVVLASNDERDFVEPDGRLELSGARRRS
jgi:hypothetical protein